MKAIATWHATRTIQECREACGGAGYLAENRLPGLKADTDVFTTFEGDNTVLLQLVGKELLTDFKDHFGELDLLGAARFVADQAVDTAFERIGARHLLRRVLDAADEPDVRDRNWLLDLFEFRERHTLQTLARRLRRAADSQDPFAVFNDAQDHLLVAARAHLDAVLLHAFIVAIDGCPDDEAREVLSTVCDLFALSTIEGERGWFQEHGHLTRPRAKRVIATVNRLCQELRPQAGILVDAFAIPDRAIGDLPLLR